MKGPSQLALEAALAPLRGWSVSFEYAEGTRAAELSSRGHVLLLDLEMGRPTQRCSSLDEALDVLRAKAVDVDFGSVDVSSPGSKAAERNALRALAVPALVEVVGGVAPSERELAASRKAFLARKKASADAASTERRAQKQSVERAEAEHDARVLAEARAEVVDSVPRLIEVLEKRLRDASRVKKALSMLQEDGFQLFHDVRDDQLVGVVRSQTSDELVYACTLAADGAFSCCTQNLNVCGGLKGKPCKHLLVLLLGLGQSGELALARANNWMVATLVKQPKLDRERAAQVFLRYRGATTGELEWRPTETTPEDFYAY